MFNPTILLLLMTSPLGAVTEDHETKSITEAENVLAIYNYGISFIGPHPPRLIIGIWGDGTIVWSEDKVQGGAPYYTAQLNPKDVAAVLNKIDNMGAFEVPGLEVGHYGFDAIYTTILVRTNGKQLWMASWHDLGESGGNWVGTDHGLEVLGDRKRLPVLAKQSAEYLHFRLTWLELRLLAENLIPNDGKKTNGKATTIKDKLAWQSEKDKPNR